MSAAVPASAACQKLSPECDPRTRLFILLTASLCQHVFKTFTMR
ncbi:hypothetical protein AVDCRST_MAG94-2423 [uncultured Leptolyngbya sp.]|uniref:Uncharacterized protein n=1 Tax=uncultured Leptolyngbya sp. TaxID=332963 RepID=A0A6J4LVP8_9CYAN|nr:hypothetical protein AVDCRST_MAG94-2423 [uncultured Leptolyngbya sp.]